SSSSCCQFGGELDREPLTLANSASTSRAILSSHTGSVEQGIISAQTGPQSLRHELGFRPTALRTMALSCNWPAARAFGKACLHRNVSLTFRKRVKTSEDPVAQDVERSTWAAARVRTASRRESGECQRRQDQAR